MAQWRTGPTLSWHLSWVGVGEVWCVPLLWTTHTCTPTSVTLPPTLLFWAPSVSCWPSWTSSVFSSWESLCWRSVLLHLLLLPHPAGVTTIIILTLVQYQMMCNVGVSLLLVSRHSLLAFLSKTRAVRPVLGERVVCAVISPHQCMGHSLLAFLSKTRAVRPVLGERVVCAVISPHQCMEHSLLAFLSKTCAVRPVLGERVMCAVIFPHQLFFFLSFSFSFLTTNWIHDHNKLFILFYTFRSKKLLQERQLSGTSLSSRMTLRLDC